MSHKVTSAVFETSGQQAASDRLHLLGLADHASPDGANIRPGIDRLAAFADGSTKTSRRSIARLEAGGWIWVHRRPGKTSHYVLLIGGLTPLDPAGWECQVCLDEARRWHPEAGTECPHPGCDDTCAAPVDKTTGRLTAPRTECPHTPDTRVPTTPDTGVRTPRTPVSPEPLRTTSGTTNEPLPPDGGESAPPPDDHPTVAIARALLAADVDDTDLDDISDRNRRRYLTAAADIHQLGGTADQVPAAARAYRRQWPDVVWTPMAMAKHWLAFAAGPDDTGPTEQAAIALAIAWSGQDWDDVADRLAADGHTGDHLDAAHDAWHQHQPQAGAA